jgi:hypothetical protein
MTDWRIEHGDCVDIMPRMEPGIVRLIFCDPPYSNPAPCGRRLTDELSRSRGIGPECLRRLGWSADRFGDGHHEIPGLVEPESLT